MPHPEVKGATVPLDRLRAEADRISGALDRADAARPPATGGSEAWHRWRAGRDAAWTKIGASVEAGGGRITERWDGARIRYLGIAASSTSGLSGALRNWVAAARRRAELERSA